MFVQFILEYVENYIHIIIYATYAGPIEAKNKEKKPGTGGEISRNVVA